MTINEILAAHPQEEGLSGAMELLEVLRAASQLAPPATVTDVERLYKSVMARIRLIGINVSAAKQAALALVVGNPAGNALAGGFLHGHTPLAFVHFDRPTIAAQLVCRIIRPRLVGQGNHPLCGPNVVVQDVAERNPAAYADFVIGLAENGQATLQVNANRNGLPVAIGQNSGILHKHDHMNAGYRIAQADYIPLASLREASSWLPYRAALTNRTLQGASGGAQVKQWLIDAGYQDAHDKTYQFASRLAMMTKPANVRDALYGDKTRNSIAQAEGYLSRGYAVILCGTGNLSSFTLGINPNDSAVMLLFGGHWMRVREIVIKNDGVDLSISTWQLSNDQKKRVSWSKLDSWYRGFVCGDPS